MRASIGFVVLTFAAGSALAQVWYTPPTDASATRAVAFMRTLVAKSPDHDGVPLRRHSIEDIDLDGRFEVVEEVSEREERTPGFLAVEKAPPCTWLRIYRDGPVGFVEATDQFRGFLLERQSFYQHWVKYLRASDSDPQRVRSCAEENLTRVESMLGAAPKP